MGLANSEIEIVKKMLEVTRRLRNVEQRKKNTVLAVDKEGRLLLTKEEWLARLKLRDDTGKSNGPSSRKGGKKPWKSRGRMRGKEADQKKEPIDDDGPIQCLYCGKRGHLSKNCWSKLRNNEMAKKAHVAQSEEDEPALFMGTASVLPDVPNSDSKSTKVIDDGITAPVSVEPEEELSKSTRVIDDGITAPVSVEPVEELPKSTEVIDDGITAPVSVEPEEELPKSTEVIDNGITAPVSIEPEEELPKSTEVIDDGITSLVSVEPEEELQLCITKASAGEPIQLKEERVFAEIGERGKQQEHRRWVLDTGATNHMNGAKSAFSELDSEICGMVKFGDGSIVEIEGRDTILFIGKGGKHHKLTDVYFILRLKANIVSLGQLDKAGCNISIKRGLLRICNDQRRLLT